MEFTDEQRKIFSFVENESGHGIIDAVAGAGKTTTIMESVKYVNDKSQVLFCAFNKSIASEIDNKFKTKGLNEVTTKTIHSLGLDILKDNNSTGKDIVLKENKYLEIIKDSELNERLLEYAQKIVKYYGYEYNPDSNRQPYEVENVLRVFSNRLIEINNKFRLTLCKDGFEEFKNMIIHYGIFNETEIEGKYFNEEVEAYLESHQILIERGNELSKKMMVIDYADMLYLPYEWKQYPIKKYNFVFIDECQDLSRSQLAVALKYAKRESRILSVGDPRQSIYGFTGADINSFSNIEKYTKAKKLPLTICFRCPQKVIEIAKDFRNDIVGSKNYDGNIAEIRFDQVSEIAQPNDLIICRTKAPLLLLVFDFIEKEKKVKIHPDIANDLINQLRKLFKKEELLRNIILEYKSFEKLKNEVFTRRQWIINKEAERIYDSDSRKLYIEDEIRFLESKLEFLHKRYEKWKESCENLEDIFKRIKLYVSEKDNPITISTIHSAKGLEEKRVFIINYSDLPLKRAEQKDWEIIQEINLKYVAVTRATEELFLINSPKIDELENDGNLFDELFEI